ncbi:MAG: monofunctional biosynthetic peptidoglycan transglycosylase [Ferruginibacter sp.]
MISKPSSKRWNLIKKIFFVIFIIHTAWFLIFIFQKFSEVDFVVSNLKTKVLLIIALIIAASLVYYFLLRKIVIVKRIAKIAKEVFFICYISSFIYLLLGCIFNPPVTLTQLANLVEGNGLKRDYVSSSNLGSNIKLAVLASEDQLFPDHDGFDLKAIKKAIKYNKRHVEKQRGGSTISQQTAKNIFLWQGGGFFRKGLEVYFTFSIEKLWSKETILSRYLNIAEMGKGIFGAQAAAQAYFNKDAKDLTRQQAAMIAACLPNPKKFTVVPLSRYVQLRAANIMRQMSNLETDPDIQELIK